jgi:hypothetical protein
MSRKSKIARLPRHIRDHLNRRLDDGEPSVKLVDWLNSQADVRRVLAEDFDGRPINEQNISDWKQGGFLDWQQHQECRDWVRVVADESGDVSEDAGIMPLSDHLSTMATFALGKVIRRLSSEAPSDAKKLDDLLRVLKELARLRHDDLQAARSRPSLELLDAQRRHRRSRAQELAAG